MEREDSMKTWVLLLILAVLLAFVLLFKYAVFAIIIIVGVLAWRLRKFVMKLFNE